MKTILYVNPIGRSGHNEATLEWIEAIRSPEFQPLVRSLEKGPPHLEYHTYEHEAVGPMLRLFKQAQDEGCVAGVIGCFYDGGLREAREYLDMPIIGMAEASLAYAATLGHKFSILVGRRKWIPKMEENNLLYGHGRRLASMRVIGMGIAEMEAEPDRFFDRCIEESRKAIEEDGAELVVLSEFTSPAFWKRAREEVKAPIVDPGIVCWKFAEMAADLYSTVGYSHSKIGGHEAPTEREPVLD